MSAVMGASGCGKTTFMNAIATRAPYGNVEARREPRHLLRIRHSMALSTVKLREARLLRRQR
eukprot:3705359-Pleurochrysis_carterae.AAC.1